MSSRTIRISLAAALCAALSLALAQAALAAAPVVTPIDLTYAQSARKGTLKPGNGSRFSLTLRGVSPQTLGFESSPERHSWPTSTRDFVRSWAGLGFVDAPPSAVLSELDGQDFDVASLAFVRAKKHGHRLRYRLTSPVGLPRHVKAPTLFIDDASGPVAGGCVLEPWAQCQGVDLHDHQLKNLKLQGINFRGAVLFLADFTGTDLTRADMRGADMRGTTVLGTEFHAADLRGSDFNQAHWQYARLSSVDARAADFREADMRKADLKYANLIQTDLRGADLTGATTRLTKLDGAIFCNTTMPDGKINNRDCPPS